MLSHLGLIVLLLFIVSISLKYREDFTTLPVKMPLLEENCDGDIPLISASCNKVPNFPGGLIPKNTVLNSKEYPEVPFDRLAPKTGKYTFIIPELMYDGIFSRKTLNNNCFWSTCPSKPDTYGTDNYFHVPDEELNGRTIVEPPECANMPTGYPPEAYITDCKENVPCTFR